MKRDHPGWRQELGRGSGGGLAGRAGRQPVPRARSSRRQQRMSEERGRRVDSNTFSIHELSSFIL
ncbi:hypothetical protein EYF80_029690 [Liparis tanakae]|uniref:Uncharacterized protein n=1 Tax=Liparis tanakae TaxID=230148 RepID=A0A4Z2H2P8_9TELE|nr:hypothetical protein EYF80_029690 [Liparis tanakae]